MSLFEQTDWCSDGGFLSEHQSVLDYVKGLVNQGEDHGPWPFWLKPFWLKLRIWNLVFDSRLGRRAGDIDSSTLLLPGFMSEAVLIMWFFLGRLF